MSERIPYDKLFITPGWFVVDLKTVQDCDEAMVQLARDIAHIDGQLLEEAAEADVTGVATDPAWLASANGARAMKVSLKTVVQRRQGEISRAARAAAGVSKDRQLLDRLKVNAPEAFAAALSEVGGAQ